MSPSPLGFDVTNQAGVSDTVSNAQQPHAERSHLTLGHYHAILLKTTSHYLTETGLFIAEAFGNNCLRVSTSPRRPTALKAASVSKKAVNEGAGTECASYTIHGEPESTCRYTRMQQVKEVNCE